MPINHAKTSAKSDGADTTLVRPSDWNANHTGGVEASILDAKGDLIVASSADTAAKLTVGSDDYVLTADASATYGIAWGDLAAHSTITALAARIAALEGGGSVVIPTETSIYGQAIGSGGLTNTRHGGASSPLKSYMRFRSPYTSSLNHFHVYYLGASAGYAGGTGGTIDVTIEEDDDTDDHFPSGTVLATESLAASNVNDVDRTITFSSPPNLTAGVLYHLVFENTDSTPLTNYFSLDYLRRKTLQPGMALNPKWPDTDWAHGYLSTTTAEWVVRQEHIPILDLSFTGGNWGMGYIELSYAAGEIGEINGTSKMARESFTVSGGTRTVSGVGIRLLREYGTDPLILTLQNSSGTTITSSQIAAASIQVGDTTDYGHAAFWVEVPMTATLTDATAYYLQLSTASGTKYWAWVLRKGSSSYDYDTDTVFNDGVSQKTTDGTTWSSLGRVSNQNDLQFYFATE